MNTYEVMAQIAQDEALKEKFQPKCKTPEEVYSELKELGLTDSFEEFKAAAKAMMLRAMEVNPEELDKIAAAGDDLGDMHGGEVPQTAWATLGITVIGWLASAAF